MSASTHRPDAARTSLTPATPPPAFAAPDARTVLADHPQYRLLDRLGEGGMGVVFRAEHRVMGRVVALKVMAPHLTARPEAVARFRREVTAAARLNHPHIVTAHDAGEAGGLHFLVMEFVDGTSLDRLVARKGPLAVPLACQFARQAALGLQHAADRGMVHRDVKPQNLMVTRKGLLKVLDFGLARFARDADPDPGSPGPPGLSLAATAASTVMGTPDYLSPEQARSAAVDTRADVYSLGCTLFFLLTGRPPFAAAASAFDKLVAHTTEAMPPVSAVRPDVPPGLEAVLDRMTAKDAAARYATPAEAAAALAPFARGGAAESGRFDPPPPAAVDAVPAPAAVTTAATVPVRPRPGRRKAARREWSATRWAVVIGAALAVLAGGLAVRSALRRPAAAVVAAPDPPPRPPAAKPADPPAAAPAPRPAPRVLFVLPAKGLEPDDYLPVRERLERAGVVVQTAVRPPPPFGPFAAGYSHPVREAGAAVAPVKADFEFRGGLDLSPYRAVVFVGKDVGELVGPPPGADAPKAPPAAAAAADVVRRARELNLVLGGVGAGQAVLARHGALDGRAVARGDPASPWPVAHLAPRARVEAVPVRADGRVVTSAGGRDTAAAFADALAAAVGGE